jgi:hypothetical protein
MTTITYLTTADALARAERQARDAGRRAMRSAEHAARAELAGAAERAELAERAESRADRAAELADMLGRAAELADDIAGPDTSYGESSRISGVALGVSHARRNADSLARELADSADAARQDASRASVTAAYAVAEYAGAAYWATSYPDADAAGAARVRYADAEYAHALGELAERRAVLAHDAETLAAASRRHVAYDGDNAELAAILADADTDAYARYAASAERHTVAELRAARALAACVVARMRRDYAAGDALAGNALADAWQAFHAAASAVSERTATTPSA